MVELCETIRRKALVEYLSVFERVELGKLRDEIYLGENYSMDLIRRELEDLIIDGEIAGQMDMMNGVFIADKESRDEKRRVLLTNFFFFFESPSLSCILARNKKE